MKFFLYLISTIPAFIEVSNASIDVLSRDEVEDVSMEFPENLQTTGFKVIITLNLFLLN